MSGTALLIISFLIFILAYRIYGRYLSRLFGVDPSLKPPAHNMNDGIDYVPTKLPVLFGHHFASIAGAGPIVGPVLAACFGWLPVTLWIILGCIFIGAVHDFAALCISIRNEARSIGHIIEKYIGYAGRQLFLIFCFADLLLVLAIFTILIAKTFVATPSVATSSLIFIFLAVIFGLLVNRYNYSLMKASLIFVPLTFLSIWIGILYPLDLMSILKVPEQAANQIWIVVLFIYVFFASVMPVWILLQPRDYLNSYLLYSMILLGLIGILFVSPKFNMAAFNGFIVADPIKSDMTLKLFPLLFVTVACGACSGFHAIVSSGTTAKQLNSEGHALPIGYGAMLVEGVLAIIAIVIVASLNQSEYALLLKEKGAVYVFSNGLAVLSNKIGLAYNAGLTFVSLAVSAFMLTTLDSATRITRFIFQELFMPKENGATKSNKAVALLENRYIATIVVIILTAYLTFSGDGNKIWPVFGASNQLLAALTLLVVTIILIKKKSNFWIALIPFVFMMVISFWALFELLIVNLKMSNPPLIVTTSLLLIMSVLMIFQSLFKITKA